MTTLKFIKLFVLLPLSSFLAVPAIATEIEDHGSWAQMGDGSAWVKYNSAYSDESELLEAEINHSRSGEQRLYFSDFSSKGSQICKYQSQIPTNITMSFNGQAVQMSRWCKKYIDSNNYYFDFTPKTERGHSYVVNLFRVSTSPIKIQYDNETLYFPVMGFTKAWNSAGGDAI